MGKVAPQLENSHPDMARLTVGLDLTDQRVATAGDGDVRQNVDMSVSLRSFEFHLDRSNRRNLRQKLPESLRSKVFDIFQ